MRIYSAALETARDNWFRWQDVYECEVDFCNLKLFEDSRIFLGFCKEYSVFRRSPEETLKLSYWLREQQNPKSFEEFYASLVRKFPLGNGGEKLISLASKILCNWRPQHFAMWDQYAKIGLGRWKRMYLAEGREPDLSAFSVDLRALPDNYERFRLAFFAACDADQGFGQFVTRQDQPKFPNHPSFKFRAFDNYLVELGKLSGARFQELKASKP